MLQDPVVLAAVLGVVRLCGRVIEGWTAGRRDFLRGRILVALVEAAGPGSTVVERHPDGAVLAVCRPGVTR